MCEILKFLISLQFPVPFFLYCNLAKAAFFFSSISLALSSFSFICASILFLIGIVCVSNVPFAASIPANLLALTF